MPHGARRPAHRRQDGGSPLRPHVHVDAAGAEHLAVGGGSACADRTSDEAGARPPLGFAEASPEAAPKRADGAAPIRHFASAGSALDAPDCEEHVGTPEDVGNVVSLICSEQAAWITGQVIYADGGASLMNPEVPPELQLG
ncbi:MAG: SDR family oxidoreductase [Deltaproteobacteria bacterium]|nr:MAG: SDR family oxidoreductase [Deltaproteobacteria bacterium]